MQLQNGSQGPVQIVCRCPNQGFMDRLVSERCEPYRGYFAIPDVVNMLDNERTRQGSTNHSARVAPKLPIGARLWSGGTELALGPFGSGPWIPCTRWINATLFFAIGWQVTLMVVSPSTVDVPFERFKMNDFPFILRKLLTIAYYLVVFAPVVMGLPRNGSPDDFTDALKYYLYRTSAESWKMRLIWTDDNNVVRLDFCHFQLSSGLQLRRLFQSILWYHEPRWTKHIYYRIALTKVELFTLQQRN